MKIFVSLNLTLRLIKEQFRFQLCDRQRRFRKGLESALQEKQKVLRLEGNVKSQDCREEKSEFCEV